MPESAEVFVGPGDVDLVALAATNTKGAAQNAIRLNSSLKLDVAAAQERLAEANALIDLIEVREDPNLPFAVPADQVTAARIGTGFEIGKVKALKAQVVQHRFKSTHSLDQQIRRLERLLGDLGGTPELPLPDEGKPALELEPS